jgi:ubiquinone/menaquinone biosynthesis C-methylase UbiE
MCTASDPHSYPGARALTHGTFWHSNFIQTISSYFPNLPPKACILDLACGTGLSTFILAAEFQDASSIIGVDTSPGILDIARTNPDETTDEGVRVEFYEHDILDLDSLAAVQDGAFDVITCVSASVFLPDPYKALAYWCRYLAPGGIVALHVNHPQNLTAGVVLERTAAKLSISVPAYRSWSQSEKSLRDVFEKANLEVLSIKLEHQQDGVSNSHVTDDEIADIFFDAQMRYAVADAFHAKAERSPDFLERAREVYRAEWAAQASNGLSKELNSVWVGVARKRASSVASGVPVNQPKVTGGCRCSAVRYEAYQRPTGIVECHCFTCGRLSGSGNLPFIDVPTNSFRYIESWGLKTLRFSDVADRTFCTECGSPITMVFKGTEGYEDQKGKTNIVLGSVDVDSLGDDVPGIWGHIFVGEKCIWETLPDDGARRLRKFTSDSE